MKCEKHPHAQRKFGRCVECKKIRRKTYREKENSWHRAYMRSLRAEIKKNGSSYHAERCARNLNYKFRMRFRNRLRAEIKMALGTKTGKSIDLLGCPLNHAIKYIEAQFKPGMTWDNWNSDGWHLDHIRPCASFDLSNPIQRAICFHYTNLQPLWAQENLRKSNKEAA